MVEPAVEEAVEEGSAKEAAGIVPLSTFALRAQTDQRVLPGRHGSGHCIVSTVAPSAGWAGAGVVREPGLYKVHLAAHKDSAVEAEGLPRKDVPSCPKALEEVREEAGSAGEQAPSWTSSDQEAR